MQEFPYISIFIGVFIWPTEIVYKITDRWEGFSGGTNQLFAGIYQSFYHAKDEFWLGAKVAQSELIHWLAFSRLCWLCYFYLFIQRVGEQIKDYQMEFVSGTN